MNADTIDAMLAAGVTAEVLAAAWKAEIAKHEKAAEERRAKDAERQRRHRESRDVTVTNAESCDPSPFEVSPHTPLPKTPNQVAPLNPPKSGRQMIPEDWKPPLVSELPPRARACASLWTDASYQTEAEGFVLYWRSERKMKPDWKATWANRVIARHSAVMRDQKFGNAAPDVPKYSAPKTPEDALAWWQQQRDFYRSINRPDDVKRCEAHIQGLEDANPELARKVSSIVRDAAREHRTQRAA